MYYGRIARCNAGGSAGGRRTTWHEDIMPCTTDEAPNGRTDGRTAGDTADTAEAEAVRYLRRKTAAAVDGGVVYQERSGAESGTDSRRLLAWLS